MANNWAGVSRFSRVNCETNCDWIVIVCLINALIIVFKIESTNINININIKEQTCFGLIREINTKYKNKCD
jgi:hypothetical protein